MIELQTAKLKKYVEATIDGHKFLVHALGAGTQLDLNEKIQRMGELSEEDKREYLKLTSEIVNIYLNLFDDGCGGEKTREILGELSMPELQELIKIVFTKPEADNA